MSWPSWCFFMFNELRFEMIVRFVHISRIVDHDNRINFLFVVWYVSNLSTIIKFRTCYLKVVTKKKPCSRLHKIKKSNQPSVKNH